MIGEIIKKLLSIFNYNNSSDKKASQEQDGSKNTPFLDLPEDSENLDEIDKEVMDIGFMEDDE